MAKTKRSANQLEDLFSEQLEFLRRSAQSFDGGFLSEAKRMAVSLRVLLRQTSNSHSLLHQTGRSTTEFFDTAKPLFKAEVQLPLLLQVGLKSGQMPRFRAPLDDIPDDRLNRRQPFARWWSAVIFKDMNARVLTRERMVLTCSDQDGGAHVDPALDEIYHDMLFKNSSGWTGGSGNQSGPIPDVGAHSIRQIAHEVLKTFEVREGSFTASTQARLVATSAGPG